MGYFQDRLRKFNYKPDEVVTKKIISSSKLIPNNIKIYYSSMRKNYVLYWKNRRNMDLGRSITKETYLKIKKHFYILKTKGNYDHVYKEMDERERKKKEFRESEKVYILKGYAKDHIEHVVKGGNPYKSPSVVVEK